MGFHKFGEIKTITKIIFYISSQSHLALVVDKIPFKSILYIVTVAVCVLKLSGKYIKLPPTVRCI